MAVDPLYALPQDELEQRSLEDVQHTIDRLERSPTPRADFNLESYRQGKLQALERFLKDRSAPPCGVPGRGPARVVTARSQL